MRDLARAWEGRACASLMGTCVAETVPSVQLEPRRAMPAGTRDIGKLKKSVGPTFSISQSMLPGSLQRTKPW